MAICWFLFCIIVGASLGWFVASTVGLIIGLIVGVVLGIAPFKGLDAVADIFD